MNRSAACRCGHTAEWHSHGGAGDCEHDGEGACEKFVADERVAANRFQPSTSVGIKLASLAVHADELLSPDGSAEFDGTAIKALLADPEIVAYLDLLRPMALLPEKRHG